MKDYRSTFGLNLAKGIATALTTQSVELTLSVSFERFVEFKDMIDLAMISANQWTKKRPRLSLNAIQSSRLKCFATLLIHPPITNQSQ